MSKKKGKRKSSNKSSLEKIVFATAVLNLICEVIDLIKKLT